MEPNDILKGSAVEAFTRLLTEFEEEFPQFTHSDLAFFLAQVQHQVEAEVRYRLEQA